MERSVPLKRCTVSYWYGIISTYCVFQLFCSRISMILWKKKTLPQRFIVLPIAQFWIVAYEVDERGNNGLFQVVLGLFSITFLVFNWTVYPFFNSLTCSFLNSPIMEIWLAWYLDSWLDTITARDFLFCSFCQCISIILCLVYYCAT